MSFRYFIAFLGLCFTGLPIVRAQSIPWERLPGPPGGAVLSFALLDDGTILSGSSSGVFYSADHGASWAPRSEGAINGPVWALLVTRSGFVLAAADAGLFRSSDQGLTWEAIDTGKTAPPIRSWTEDNDGRIYAGSLSDGVWISDNVGDTWVSLNEGLGDLRVRTMAFSKTGDVYAGTQDGLYRLPDQMPMWEKANDGLSQANDRVINAMLSYPSGRQYAATDGGVFESDADSLVWRALTRNPGDDGEGVLSVILTPSGELFASTRRGVFQSVDDGLTWETASDQLPGALSPLDAATLLMVNANEELLLGTTYFGVYGWIPGQRIWAQANTGYASKEVTSMAINVNGDLLAGTSTGLYRTPDIGTIWESILIDEPFTGFTLLHLANNGDLFGTSTSLVRSTNHGDSWESIWSELPEAFHAVDENTYVASIGFGEVWRTDDAAETWNRVGQIPAQPALFVLFTLAQDAQGHLLAATSGGLFRSPDLGQTWDEIVITSPSASWPSIAIDPNGRLFAGGPGGLYRSNPGGDSWEPILTGVSSVTALLLQSRTRLIAVTSDEGLFRSVDAGATWMPVNAGLPVSFQTSDVILDDRTVVDAVAAYLSLKGGGLYRTGEIIALANDQGPESPTPDFHVNVYPNPAISSVYIRFTLSAPSHVTLDLVDELGKVREVIINTLLLPGEHEAEWIVTGVPSGVYFARLRTDAGQRISSLVVGR